jgi:hypothetical protein
MINELRTSLRSLTTLQIAALVALIPTFFFINRFLLRWWIVALLVPAVLLAYHYAPSRDKGWKVVLAGFLTVIIVLFGFIVVKDIVRAVQNPPEWDYRLFWLEGKVADSGKNFYDPQYAIQLAQPFNPSEEFKSESSFFYPPPSMFLFMPLGWFDYQTAALLWYIVHTAIFVLSVVMLWQLFFKKAGLLGFLLTAALVVMFASVPQVFVYGQTTFLVLLMMLLFWQYRRRTQGGIWLAIGILTKPLVGVLLLFTFLRGQWRSLLATLGFLAVTSVLALLLFGSTTFFSYVTLNPATSGPTHLYTEPSVQSLLGTILRVTHYDFSGSSPLRNPLFIVIASVLVLVTLWLVYRQDVVSDEIALSLLLALGLLIYPATIAHYSMLLLPSVFAVWSLQKQNIRETLGAVVFITLIYVLINLSDNYVFAAQAVDWLGLAGIGVWAVLHRKTSIVATSAPSPAVG